MSAGKSSELVIGITFPKKDSQQLENEFWIAESVEF